MKNILKLGLLACLATAFVFAGCKKDDDNSKFAVTLSANNAEWGTVAGGGEFAEGTEIQIMATANSDYHFEKWSDDDTNNPRTITVDKNIALIAIFAEGNGGGTVNGGENGNSNSGNNGTATGDILPKKVTKIIYTYANEDHGSIETVYFDAEGKILSSESKSYNRPDEEKNVTIYQYSGNEIKIDEGWRTTTYKVENDRITEGMYTYRDHPKDTETQKYSYSPEGYLVSISTGEGNGNFKIENGNVVSYEEYEESDKYKWYENETTQYIYNNNVPNNLNIDIAQMIIYDDGFPLTGYFGNRLKNIPSQVIFVEESGTIKSDGTKEKGDEERYIDNYKFTYDGDYLTKIETDDALIIIEIFY